MQGGYLCFSSASVRTISTSWPVGSESAPGSSCPAVPCSEGSTAVRDSHRSTAPPQRPATRPPPGRFPSFALNGYVWLGKFTEKLTRKDRHTTDDFASTSTTSTPPFARSL